ncbi:MAG: Dolichyl-phosphate-mannose-mannosyltransferase family protein [Candidatus Collierbacteria bacterium GW2011_GWC2_44_18]|uniref:Dolichyl-phosphate-mannose-mannosyltransferase family protein n=1 Tax=Candidatus Collierbacteria bacterium GW2011_GWC2_44_18 TaxID=1618392 RepID=A0A0G1HR79_9BACT|nr:MAG: Dolichyl-phosphate-mannose-mannosyltransferase family protein [Microgenomates group bacterium GW2011_GWC1_44_10]KKT49646.1 MAG: Dolichyl-phosphate-mannose-mannosyltransferase family protein [Candidatus Collierbacteria bacterium GW2011_GWC2_44_18]
MTKNKVLWLLGLAIITLALFLFFRFYRLGQVPVFVDEAIYIRWSQVMRAEPTLRFLPLSDGKQPLFMWSTIPFLKLVSDPLIAGRFVSVFAGFGSLVGIGTLALLLFSDPFIALFSSLIYAIIPFTMFFDRMALADSLLAMFGVWSLVFAVKFAKTLQNEHAMYLGFAIGGGLLTKSPAMIFYFWALLVILFFLDQKKISIDLIKKLLWGLLLSLFISQAMYAILRLGVGFQMIGARNQDYVFSIKEVLSHPMAPFIGNIETTLNWLFLLLSPTVLLLGGLGYLNSKVRRQYILLIIVALAPLLYQAFVAKVYTSRYILYAVLPLIPLAGLGLHWLFSRKGLLIKLSITLFLSVPLLISLVYLFNPTIAPMPFDMRNGYFEEWTAGYGQKEVARYLLEQERNLPNGQAGLPAGRQVVVFTEGFFGTLPDGLQIYTEGNTNITIVGSTYYVSEIPSGLLNTSSDNLRFLVINKSRNHLSAGDLSKLELIKEYPKMVRSDGTRESLQFFRLK